MGAVLQLAGRAQAGPWGRDTARRFKWSALTSPLTPSPEQRLTNEGSNKHSGHTLLLHLLNLGLLSWCDGLAHDRQGIDVGDGAHCRRSQPGQPEECTKPPHSANEQQVQVEARAFQQLPLLLAHNQPGRKKIPGQYKAQPSAQGQHCGWGQRSLPGESRHGDKEMAEERGSGCQPQVRGFLLCWAEAGLHHTLCQEGSQETMGQPKKVQFEMTRILPLLSRGDARRTSRRTSSPACPGVSGGWCWQGRYSRSDLCLHEYKNEDQEGRDGRGKHHPHWKGPTAAHGVNEPATLVRRCDRQARGDIQLLVV